MQNTHNKSNFVSFFLGPIFSLAWATLKSPIISFTSLHSLIKTLRMHQLDQCVSQTLNDTNFISILVAVTVTDFLEEKSQNICPSCQIYAWALISSKWQQCGIIHNVRRLKNCYSPVFLQKVDFYCSTMTLSIIFSQFMQKNKNRERYDARNPSTKEGSLHTWLATWNTYLYLYIKFYHSFRRFLSNDCRQ